MLLGSADVIAQDALASCRYEPSRHCPVSPDTSGRHCAGQSPDQPSLRCAAACTRTFESGLQRSNLERLSNMGIYTPSYSSRELVWVNVLPAADSVSGPSVVNCRTRQSIRPQTRFFRQQHLLKPINNKEMLLRPHPYLAKLLEHWLIAQQHGLLPLLAVAPLKANQQANRFGGGQRQRHPEAKRPKTGTNRSARRGADVGLDMTLSRPGSVTIKTCSAARPVPR